MNSLLDNGEKHYPHELSKELRDIILSQEGKSNLGDGNDFLELNLDTFLSRDFLEYVFNYITESGKEKNRPNPLNDQKFSASLILMLISLIRSSAKAPKNILEYVNKKHPEIRQFTKGEKFIGKVVGIENEQTKILKTTFDILDSRNKKSTLENKGTQIKNNSLQNQLNDEKEKNQLLEQENKQQAEQIKQLQNMLEEQGVENYTGGNIKKRA